SNLMTQRAYQDLGPGEHLVQIELRTVSEFLRSVEYNRGQAQTGHCLVGGKPDVGQEHFAVLPPPAAFHFRVKEGSFLRRGATCQRREELADRLALQVPFLDAQKPMGGSIGELHLAGRIQGEDRGGTARDQKVQLLFRLAAQLRFPFDLHQMLVYHAPAARRREAVKTGSEERRECQDEA